MKGTAHIRDWILQDVTWYTPKMKYTNIITMAIIPAAAEKMTECNAAVFNCVRVCLL